MEFSAEDATRSDFDFLCRVIEAVDRRGRDDDQSAGHGRVFDAGRDRGVLPRRDRAACRTPIGRSSARTVTTTSAWPSPTRWPRSARACARSSARSTALASARATPSLEEIVMITRVRPDRWPVETSDRDAAALRREPAADRAHRRARAGEQGHRRPQRVRARGRHSPGRHAEGSPHLRDHAARRRRRAEDDARARQALGPARRRRSACEHFGIDAVAARPRRGLSPHDRAGRHAEAHHGRRSARHRVVGLRHRALTALPRAQRSGYGFGCRGRRFPVAMGQVL